MGKMFLAKVDGKQHMFAHQCKSGYCWIEVFPSSKLITIITNFQIEGAHCHHGADELSGRRLALHQQCREEGQEAGYAEVRLGLRVENRALS